MPEDTHNSRAVSDTDIMLIGAVAVFFAGAIAAAAAHWWNTAVHWMLAHQLLAPAAFRPILVVPAAAGAGFDFPRLLILTALILAGSALAGRAVTKRLHSSRQA